jgi:hypothetical protein
MRTFSYLSVPGLLTIAMLAFSTVAGAQERRTPEVTLKKTSDCDAALSDYANEGQPTKPTYVMKKQVRRTGSSAPQATRMGKVGVVLTDVR